MSDLKVVADPGTQEIVITRTFDAPRDLVFKAFTDPGHPRGLDIPAPTPYFPDGLIN